MAQDKNYANAWFSKIGKEFDDGTVIWSIGIKPEEFIDWLTQLPVNDKGFINLSLGESRNRDKIALWENDFKPSSQEGGSSNGRGGAARGGRQQTQSRNGGSNRNSGRSNAGSGATRGSNGGASRGRTNTRTAPQTQTQTDDLPF